MMSKLGVTKATKMLEIGSGAGGTSVYIATKYGCTVHGVDLNPHGQFAHVRVRGVLEVPVTFCAGMLQQGR